MRDTPCHIHRLECSNTCSTCADYANYVASFSDFDHRAGITRARFIRRLARLADDVRLHPHTARYDDRYDIIEAPGRGLTLGSPQIRLTYGQGWIDVASDEHRYTVVVRMPLPKRTRSWNAAQAVLDTAIALMAREREAHAAHQRRDAIRAEWTAEWKKLRARGVRFDVRDREVVVTLSVPLATGEAARVVAALQQAGFDPSAK